jgi:hypothetical protein
MSDHEASAPAPPQPNQRQSPPGTTSEMTPTPDHGEHSYKGSMKLPRFCGHRNVCVQGVRDGQNKATLCA